MQKELFFWIKFVDTILQHKHNFLPHFVIIAHYRPTEFSVKLAPTNYFIFSTHTRTHARAHTHMPLKYCNFLNIT
jgi:hypothetical protein